MSRANRLPRPLSHSQVNPALKYVQTPHPQSARMLISWEQSRGVYITPPRADLLSAELLLSQPAVNTVAFAKSFHVLIPRICETNLFIFSFCSSPRMLLSQFVLLVSLAPAPTQFPTVPFPRSSSSTPREPRWTDFHGPSLPVFSPDFHGFLVPFCVAEFTVPALELPGSQASPSVLSSFVDSHEKNH